LRSSKSFSSKKRKKQRSKDIRIEETKRKGLQRKEGNKRINELRKGGRDA
jgi:hypothetical protein